MCKSGYWLLTAVVSLSACTIRPDKFNIDGTDVELVFLHTSDIHSRLLPYDMDVMFTDENLGLKPENAPFGGIARLGAVVTQTRRDFERVAYIETGDVFQGAPIFNSFGGEPEFRAMTQLGVDAFAIGNHEFDNGTSFLVKQATSYANFPMIAANYILSDPEFVKNIPTGRIASPYSILNIKGLRVGVIGLGYVGGSPFHGGAAKGVLPLRHKDTVQAYVDYLRPIVDLVVVASHASYHTDLEYIPRTEGIDVVLGGHLHIALNPPNVLQDCDIPKLKRERDQFKCDSAEKLAAEKRLCVDKKCKKKPASEQTQCEVDCINEAKAACKRKAKNQRYADRLRELDEDIDFLEQRGCHPRNVLLVHSGAFLKYIGRLQVTLRQCHRLKQTKICLERNAAGACVKRVNRRCVGGGAVTNDWEVVGHDYRLIAVDKQLPEDPAMLRLLERYTVELNQQQLLSGVVGYTSRRLFRFSKGSGDSELGNLVTGSMLYREPIWADFTLSNSLGIRSDLIAGPVTHEHMTNVFPFENSVTVLFLSGYEVQEMMDFVARRSASRGCQSQVQVSGMTATLNCGGCSGNGGNKCVRQSYDGEPCAQDVTIGGSGRPCKVTADCAKDAHGNPTGEICTTQQHGDKTKTGYFRCGMPISLACSRSYKLATNDYIAHGGSGFSVLARNKTQKNLYIPLREATKDYILNMPACSQIPRTYKEKMSLAAPQNILSEQDRQELKRMEAAALARDLSGANKTYRSLVYNPACTTKGQSCSKLQKRKQELDTKIAGMAAGSYSRLQAINERQAYINFLSCVGEAKDSDGRCVGIACWQIKKCTDYAAEDRSKCETLSRVRAALRCMTLPCIDSSEDGRINRIFRDAAGPPHTDPDYPG